MFAIILELYNQICLYLVNKIKGISNTYKASKHGYILTYLLVSLFCLFVSPSGIFSKVICG